MLSVEQFFQTLLELGVSTPAGIKLPTERELARLTGLSRATVREYLSALRIMGLLNKTQGSANILHAPTEESSGAIYGLLLQLNHATEADAVEAREMFEIGMMPFVCRRIGPGDIERLTACVDRMTAASRAGDAQEGIEADLAFHRALFQSLNNPMIDFAFAGLRTLLRDALAVRRQQALQAEIRRNNGVAPEFFATDTVHLQVVDALLHHDPQASVAAMTFHYQQFRDLVSAD
ncbi:MAG: FadR/GntR family transcriptional regulator [Arachnia sp.]